MTGDAAVAAPPIQDSAEQEQEQKQEGETGPAPELSIGEGSSANSFLPHFLCLLVSCVLSFSFVA